MLILTVFCRYGNQTADAPACLQLRRPRLRGAGRRAPTVAGGARHTAQTAAGLRVSIHGRTALRNVGHAGRLQCEWFSGCKTGQLYSGLTKGSRLIYLLCTLHASWFRTVEQVAGRVLQVDKGTCSGSGREATRRGARGSCGGVLSLCSGSWLQAADAHSQV